MAMLRLLKTLPLGVAAAGAASQAPAEEVAAAKVQLEKSPLQKVLTLIQDMKSQVEKEAKEDETAYSKYECWCTTNDKEKTEAIEEAASRIADLVAFLEEGVAKEGQLKSEIESLAADIAEDKDALASATALREKEKGEFEAAEKDMKETLAALKEAVSVLSSVQLLQGQAPEPAVAQSLLQVRRALQRQVPRFQDVLRQDLFDVLGSLEQVLPQEQPKMSTAFLGEVFLNKRDASALEQQASDAAPTGAAAGAKSYNSRSGQILGMLSAMSDQFTRDLTNAHKTEMTALVQFQHLRAAKLGEIKAGEEQQAAKEAELAELKGKMAEAKKDQANLEKAKAADEEFLANLKDSCAMESEEYDKRVAVRSEEVRALGETLKILTEDDARDLFGKTMSFVQVAASSKGELMRARATRRLNDVASRHGSLALASLAARVKLDAFEKVKAAMDKMMAELKKQQQEEYEKNDFCKAAIDKNEDEIKVAEQEKADLNAKHLEVSNDIEVIEDTMAKLKADVEAMEIGLKQAGEARKAENGVFQTSIADQRATMNILHKALERLKMFYEKKDSAEASLVQVRAHAEPGAAAPPPPPTPKDYSKSASAGGVLQLIAEIITDAEATEKEMEMSEQKAQEAYAALVRDSTASIEADRAAIAQKESEHAEARGVKSETQEAQLANEQQLGKLNDLLGARHAECDWVMKYFDVRQQARGEEMEAIENAKAILSGADFGK
eukprot:TRINITY_DN31837_c0_g1_i1.p1 TRINITY_DN31837_c0_g1~~TRINITY_DN31837_c0_g1_i1.p1  ORF type:complete len:753 (-),score=309.39 TRINITY_DN31837_c0_g1_i1:57-2234(-)